MITTKPSLTYEFEESIRQKAEKGSYRVDVNGVLIDVFPFVFPPQSPFSESTRTIYDYFGKLNNLQVLDVGTGSGIQAIQASLAGAEKVDAVDISKDSVLCAKHNVRLNNLEDKISVWESDLFSNIPEKKYDLIIANLPFVDFEEKDIRVHSLYDPGFIYHKRLFEDAPRYLSKDGRITLSHANIQEGSFEKLENLANANGFSSDIKQKIQSIGYEWRNYDFEYKGGIKK